MGKKISLKDKVVKMYKKNDSAGRIYGEFLKNKTEIEKKEAIEIFIKLAKVEIKDKILRAKALAMLGFFKCMCCGDEVEAYYKDGSIICEYQNIPIVIEDNCKEVISILNSSKRIDLQENKELYGITTAIIHCLYSYQVSPKIALKLFDLLEKKLNLKEKKRSGKMSQRDLHVYEQVLSLRQKLT